MSAKEFPGLILDDQSWNPAQYPPGLNEVHLRWVEDSTIIGNYLFELTERLSLSEAVTPIEGEISTSDGYVWRAFLPFKGEGYRIALALPHCTDVVRHDGTLSDRKATIFTHGVCDEADVTALLQNIATAFDEIRVARSVAA